MAELQTLKISDTGYLTLPDGTSTQRVSNTEGHIRFNTTLGKIEIYQNGIWNIIGDELPANVSDGLELLIDPYATSSYPNAGNTWYDLSGNGRHGAGTNVTLSTDGTRSMSFDDTEFEAIYVDHDSEISSAVFGDSPNLTLETWINMDIFQSYQPYIGKSNGGNWSNNTAAIWGYGGNNVRFVIGTARSGNASGSYDEVTYNGFSPGNWYHVVGVLETINGVGEMRLYQNGVLQRNTTLTLTYPRIEHTSFIRIGSVQGSDYAIDGNVGMVAAYSKALTQEEIDYQFNLRRERYGV